MTLDDMKNWIWVPSAGLGYEFIAMPDDISIYRNLQTPERLEIKKRLMFITALHISQFDSYQELTNLALAIGALHS